MKDIGVKVKRETKELFFKPIIVTKDYMDMFEKKKEMKKISPIKQTSFDWLISHIPKPIGKSESGFKYKILSIFSLTQLNNLKLKRV